MYTFQEDDLLYVGLRSVWLLGLQRTPSAERNGTASTRHSARKVEIRTMVQFSLDGVFSRLEDWWEMNVGDAVQR